MNFFNLKPGDWFTYPHEKNINVYLKCNENSCIKLKSSNKESVGKIFIVSNFADEVEVNFCSRFILNSEIDDFNLYHQEGNEFYVRVPEQGPDFWVRFCDYGNENTEPIVLHQIGLSPLPTYGTKHEYYFDFPETYNGLIMPLKKITISAKSSGEALKDILKRMTFDVDFSLDKDKLCIKE